MKYKHIIFDWNGTLLDDVWLAVDVIDKMLTKRGLKGMTLQKYSDIFDFPVKDYYQAIGFDFNKESFEIVGTEFIVEYNKRQYECVLQNGVQNLLDFLDKNHIYMSVLSAREHATLIENLNFYGISNYFSTVSGLEDHYANGKIDNGILLIENSHIDAAETLLIGDTLHDAEVANEMNIDCILLSSGHQSVERLKKANVNIFNTLAEIHLWIEKNNLI